MYRLCHRGQPGLFAHQCDLARTGQNRANWGREPFDRFFYLGVPRLSRVPLTSIPRSIFQIKATKVLKLKGTNNNDTYIQKASSWILKLRHFFETNMIQWKRYKIASELVWNHCHFKQMAVFQKICLNLKRWLPFMSIDTVSSPRSRFNIPHVNVFLNRL